MHAAAAVVADDEDVFDLEQVDGELDHREAIEVGVHHHVGDIAMHEDFTRCQAHDLVRRHARIGTTDPQVLRRLLLRQALEELRVVAADLVGPLAVVA